MSTSTVVDLTKISQTFPELPDKSIQRDHILDTIDEIFSGGTDVVIVEGVEGIGRTTTLMQFALRHPMQTFSLFVRGTSRMAYDPDFMQYDLCNQLNWLIHKQTLDSPEKVSEETLRVLLTAAQKLAKEKREDFYFIVDGLDELPESGINARESILGLLPLGIRRFRFLLSGNDAQLRQLLPRQIAIKAHQLSRFSLDEAIRYFEDIIDIVKERASIIEIYNSLQKLPGYLASARRVLTAGRLDLQQFLANMANNLPSPFEVEWSNAPLQNDHSKLMLAILAFGQNNLSVAELSKVAKINEELVSELITRASFLTYDDKGRIGYVSDTFRKYAITHLNILKDKAYSLLIDYMLQESESDLSLSLLPDYFRISGRLPDLLEYLSPEHFSKVLEKSQSFGSLKQKTGIGINAAIELKRDSDLIRLAIQNATICELDGVDIWRSEIEACTALKDYSAAISLAQAAVAKEDRLQLLALIAKAQYEEGGNADPLLTEQIEQLYHQLDTTTLDHQRTIDIASDLLYVNKSLAVELIEKVAQSDGGENSMDWAFAGLSFAALATNSSEGHRSYIDVFEKLRSRITDPQTQKIHSAVSVLIGNLSSLQVINEVEKLENVSERLFLMRSWTLDNRERADALELVEYALKQIVQTTDYAPNARDFRHLATPLPLTSDIERLRKLVGIFDGQKDTVEHLGPTEEYVRLQLLLASAEYKYDPDATCNRIVDIYFYICKLPDVSLRSKCLARLVSVLNEDELYDFINEREGLGDIARSDLSGDVKYLLSNTADHLVLLRGTIVALAKSDPSGALDLCLQLNTETRRERGIFHLVRALINQPLEKVDWDFVISCVNRIGSHFELGETLLVDILEKFNKYIKPLTEQQTKFVLSLFNQVITIRSSGRRCQSSCLLYNVLISQHKVELQPVCDSVLMHLHTSWESMDIEWHRIDIGFRIAKELAKNNSESARIYVEESESLRSKIALEADTAAECYLANINLAIKSFGGLLPKGLDTPDDLDQLRNLIDHIPSQGERAKLWSHLALRFFIYKRSDIAKDIVSNHVRPLWSLISPNDVEYRASVLVDISPSIYLTHKTLALEEIARLPWLKRQESLMEISLFILRKVTSSESYSYVAGQGYNITYEEAVDLCEILSLMEMDELIYSLIESITDSIVSRSKALFTRNQKQDIAQRLNTIIKSKLPDPQKRSIVHPGYKIVSMAKVGRLTNEDSKFWEDLIQYSRNEINNLSDRTLIFSIIAAAMPSHGKHADAKKKLVKETLECTDKIPATYDKIDRYEALASLLAASDTAQAKKCIEQGMKLSITYNDPLVYSSQKSLIDLAQTIDENFAASLTSLLDNDPARVEMRRNVKEYHNLLTLKSEIAKFKVHGSDRLFKSDFPKVASMLLGSLNANRLSTFDTDYMRNFANAASRLSFSEAYPIIDWLVANANARFSNTDQARIYIRSLFDALLRGAEMAERLSLRSQNKMRYAKNAGIRISASDAEEISVLPGQRDKVIDIIRNWFTKDACEVLTICDEYFGPEDLWVLNVLLSVKPKCKVYIITSRKHQIDEKVTQPWDDAYKNYWKMNISSDQSPPPTEVVIVGNVFTQKSPIHDRIWLTEHNGLKFGTSLNSLGITQDSSITILQPQIIQEKQREIDRYLVERKREDGKGDKLSYTTFTLD